MIIIRSRTYPVASETLRGVLTRELPEVSYIEMAKESGVHEDQIRRILHPTSQSFKYVSFELADRILTGLGLHHLWHSDDGLQEVYRFLDDDEYFAEFRREQQRRRRIQVALLEAARRVLEMHGRCRNGHLNYLHRAGGSSPGSTGPRRTAASASASTRSG